MQRNNKSQAFETFAKKKSDVIHYYVYSDFLFHLYLYITHAFMSVEECLLFVFYLFIYLF